MWITKTFVVRCGAGLAPFGAGLATGLVAQTTGDPPQRVELKRSDLSGAPGMAVIASVHGYKTGEAIKLHLHLHHGIEAGHVLQGAMVRSPGKDPAPLPTGASLLNLRDVKHGSFKVVGDVPLKLFTVHIVDKGKPRYGWGR